VAHSKADFRPSSIAGFIAALALTFATGCAERDADTLAPVRPPSSAPLSAPAAPLPAVQAERAELVGIVSALVDPAKLDSLTGERAANPRLRKICYWLETARRAGFDPGHVIDDAHTLARFNHAERASVQRAALNRNLTILTRLGCLDPDGMDKLRRGRAPTITAGPYAGELVEVDRILPRSIVPELDNKLFNLEVMPATLNGSKSNKIGVRQRQLAERWHAIGLLSDAGFRAVEA